MIKVYLTLTLMLFTTTDPKPPPVIYTAPPICEYLPDGEWEACKAPTDWNDFCWSVTHYWPFDEDGNLVAGNNQTDSDPTKTATGWNIYSVEQSGDWVALPLPLITNGYYSYACFYGWGCLPAYDTFGHPTYQAGGFWHSGYQEKVVPVDVFSEEPYHYLSCSDNDNPNRIRLAIYKDYQITNP